MFIFVKGARSDCGFAFLIPGGRAQGARPGRSQEEPRRRGKKLGNPKATGTLSALPTGPTRGPLGEGRDLEWSDRL